MTDFKKIIRRIKKRIWYLLKRPGLVLLLVVLFCILLSIFYFLLIQRGYHYQEPVVEINSIQYTRVIERWNDDREENENLKHEKYFNIFSGEKNIHEIERGDEEVENKEDDNEDEEPTVELKDLNKENFSAEEIEELLAQTLFQFYEKKGMGMPQISERAQIWEDFQLGKAEEYKGLYEQNILLLRKLKEKMENTDKY